MSRSPKHNTAGDGASNAARSGGMWSIRNVAGRGVPDLQVQAIIREISWLFQPQFVSIQERMDQMEERTRRENTPPNPIKEKGRWWQHDNDLYEASYVESDQASNQSERRRGHRNWGLREREWVDDDLKNIKMVIPPFQGKTDLEAYLEWEKYRACLRVP